MYVRSVITRLGKITRKHALCSPQSLSCAAVEREIELEGVSRFHCQINRVFLRRASERFHSGLERLFQRLYRHLTLSQSSDTIITVCVECWLKMCTLVGKMSTPESSPA